MSKKLISSALTLSLSTLFLTACGGGDGGDAPSTFVHIYNASPGSTALIAEFDDNDEDTTNQKISNVVYGAISKITTEAQTYSVELSGYDTDRDEEDLQVMEFKADGERQNVYVLYGPDNHNLQAYKMPSFTYDWTEELNYEDVEGYDNTKDYFRLYIGDFSTNSTSYNICMDDNDDEYENSELLFTTTHQEIQQVSKDGKDIETDNSYTFYVLPTTATCGENEDDILFTAQNVSLNASIGYILMLRDSIDSPTGGLAMDRIALSSTDSISSINIPYEDAEGPAQYRMFNATAANITAEVSYDQQEITLASGANSDFATNVPASDYSMTIKGSESVPDIAGALQLNLARNSSESIVFFTELDGTTSKFNLRDQVRPATNFVHISLLNLAYQSSDMEEATTEDELEDVDVEDVNLRFRNLDTDDVDGFPNVGYKDEDNKVFLQGNYAVTAYRDDDLETILVGPENFTFEPGENWTLVLYKDSVTDTNSYDDSADTYKLIKVKLK